MPPYTLIDRHEEVLATFGSWPSFHDGEVQRLLLDSTRRDHQGSRVASIELTLRAWNMVPNPAEPGFYSAINDTTVEFLFENVHEVELDGLNHQNVLSELTLSLVESKQSSNKPHLLIELQHCYGLSGHFRSEKATILSVKPYETRQA